MIGTTLITKKGVHLSMVDSSAIQPYLKGIGHRYEQWRRDNALTDTIAAQQATFTFEQFVQTEDKQPNQQSQTRTLPLFKGIRDYVELEHILLVGSPGVGKSSALWYCLDAFAKEELESSQPRIPVLVQLKGYRDSFASSEDPSGLLALILSSIRPYLRLSTPEIYDLLCQKRLILLVDGLNEMPAGVFHTHLKAFREECQELDIPLICSTRELGGGDLGIQRKLEIQPLNYKETERFLQQCLPEHQEQVRQLLQRDNRELSRTPFVLWMLYHLLKETGTLAETLGESFREFFRFHFRKYKEDAPVLEERRKSWNLWLEHLAFSMLNLLEPLDPGFVIGREDAENILSERFGEIHVGSSRIHELEKYHLLEQVTERKISFNHQLIQEYYAAECLLEKLGKEPQLLRSQPEQEYAPFQLYYLNHRKWTETLAILVSFSKLNEFQSKQLIELALEVDCMLGARVAGASCYRPLQAYAVQYVNNLEMPTWLKVELLKTTNSDEALPTLLKYLNSEDSDVIQVTIQALGKLKCKASIPYLLDFLDNGSILMQCDAAEALGNLGYEDVIPFLLDAFHEKHIFVCKSIERALKKLGSEKVVPILLQDLKEENADIRCRAVELLGELGDEEVIHHLIAKIKDKNPKIRKNVVVSLGKIGHEKALPFLLDILNDKNVEVLASTATALGQIGGEKALLGLLKLLERSNFDRKLSDAWSAFDWSLFPLKLSIAHALGKIGNSKAIPSLLGLLFSKGGCAIWATIAEALNKLEDKQALPLFIAALEHKNPSVRINAINALEKLADRLAIPCLLKALEDKNSDVRWQAIDSASIIVSATKGPAVEARD